MCSGRISTIVLMTDDIFGLLVFSYTLLYSVHHGPNVGAHFLPGKATYDGN
jgi:hypothetical protein